MADETYEKALEKDARDLLACARAGELPAVDFRDELIDEVIEQLDRKRSVLLTGTTGVGKSAVVHGVATRLSKRSHGPVLFEISTTAMMSGTRYLGEWQTKATKVANSAATHGSILYFTDIWNLPRVGRTANNDATLLDALRPFLESGRLRVIGEASPEVHRAMQRVQGFTRLFHVVDVEPLSDERVDAALRLAAERRSVEIDHATRTALVKLTSRFLATRPQPGPALSLLSHVLYARDARRADGQLEPVTPAFVEEVFSTTYGLPPFVVSRRVTMTAAEIRAWFSERIVGQLDAINAVIETIALFKSGLHDPSRPIGTFLFVGPTGVGKTELARALATFVFGGPQRLLRFDLSELKDYSSFEQLLGDPDAPDKPARLLDPVRAHPFQVVLFDELEKAHPNVWDIILPLLDEGRLTAPTGETVDFRNTIFIATSNVGAQEAAARGVGFGVSEATDHRVEKTRKALDGAFRPEFLNRFQHVVVFHSLSTEQMRTVARQEMARVLMRDGIAGQSLVVDIEDEALDFVISKGVDKRFGARALKREVQRQLVLPLAMTLMEREVLKGSILKVSVREGELRIRVVDTEESRAERDEQAPARSPEGRAVSRSDITDAIERIHDRISALSSGIDEPRVSAERERLLAARDEPGFWRDVAKAAQCVREIERRGALLDRLVDLRGAVGAARDALERANGRTQLEAAARRVRDIDDRARDAERELLRMGPDGYLDALVEIRPVGGTGREARDMLVEVYSSWARSREMQLEWLRDPREDDEPAFFWIRGAYAAGMLRAETGLHRLRLPSPDRSGAESAQGKLVVASVRVAPLRELDEVPEVANIRHRPLKATGHFGCRIRSHIELDLAEIGAPHTAPLIFETGLPAAELRKIAIEVALSWITAPPASEELVRRYDR
ncbi:MAG: AAA family ATPase, partial [Polyangiaceae bacterium]